MDYYLEHYYYTLWGYSSFVWFDDLTWYLSRYLTSFLSDHFSIQKSYWRFSKWLLIRSMSRITKTLKEWMEQNVLNHRDMSGMERWENCFPDLPRIIESSETQTATDFDAKKSTNHEDTRTFQCRFYSDSNKIFEGMDVNAFEQEVLGKTSNASVVSDHKVIMRRRFESPFVKQLPIWPSPPPLHIFPEAPTFDNIFLAILDQWYTG